MCGYCGRGLEQTDATGNYECPRCAPQLREMARGLGFDQAVDAWRAFHVAARSSKPKQGRLDV